MTYLINTCKNPNSKKLSFRPLVLISDHISKWTPFGTENLRRETQTIETTHNEF